MQFALYMLLCGLFDQPAARKWLPALIVSYTSSQGIGSHNTGNRQKRRDGPLSPSYPRSFLPSNSPDPPTLLSDSPHHLSLQSLSHLHHPLTNTSDVKGLRSTWDSRPYFRVPSPRPDFMKRSQQRSTR